MEYITFEEYKSFGGIADETTFPSLLIEAESKLNYYTFGRLKELEVIPEPIKKLVTKMINILCSSDTNRNPSITSYSNGIESFSYSNDNSSGFSRLDAQLYNTIKEYLWEYPNLLYRGVR